MRINKRALAVAIAALSSPALWAQGDIVKLDEVVVVGKLKSAADDVQMEKMESEVVADIIDAEMIGRIGDSTVAAALRRVPGVTLIDDKYVFVRGLGERYATSLLNGAVIPSPDLTRNVIPLDIFPTSILKSVAVHKGYSADFPAAFSGGLVDIRTKGIPDELLFNIEVGSGYNSETKGDVLGYAGGSDDEWGEDDGTRALNTELRSALSTYRGSLNAVDILETLQLADGSTDNLADAQSVNSQLATQLNRNVDIRDESRDEPVSAEVNLGNNFYFDNGMEVGFLLGGAYDSSWKSSEVRSANAGDAVNQFTDRQVSTYNVSTTMTAALGWRWYDDHSLTLTSMVLRNTDDKSTISDYYGSSTLFADGRGNRDYTVRFEERELEVNQLNGDHRFGGVVKDTLGINGFDWADDLTVEWFYSDSTVTTDIPNEVRFTYLTTVDSNGELLTQTIQAASSAGDFRFTTLDDEVENYGWEVSLPLYWGADEIVLSGGYNYAKKARVYQQTQFSLGSTSLTGSGMPSELFSDANLLDSDLGIQMDVVGSNGESYLAAVINTAIFGKVDWKIGDSWRVTAGARWEDYSQAGLPWDPLDYSGCQISCDTAALESSVFKDDDYYPALAVTYIRPGFWAEDFQLRFNWSETIVRPDLREITPSTYIDPITDAIVKGNADVVPATVTNYDLRGEWYFGNGDTLTASLFYKDITDPIEFFESAAFEDALAAEIINASSGEITGLELEWLKSLEFLGDSFMPFFVAGNLTVLDTELDATGSDADAPTNPVRAMTGASDLAFNMQLGYDSNDGKHAAMLVYNVFDERLYLAGRNGSADSFEQPFQSLDMTYSFYPNENSTIKLKVKNLLDESIEIEQNGVVTFTKAPGMSVSIDYKWSF